MSPSSFCTHMSSSLINQTTGACVAQWGRTEKAQGVHRRWGTPRSGPRAKPCGGLRGTHPRSAMTSNTVSRNMANTLVGKRVGERGSFLFHAEKLGGRMEFEKVELESEARNENTIRRHIRVTKKRRMIGAYESLKLWRFQYRRCICFTNIAMILVCSCIHG